MMMPETPMMEIPPSMPRRGLKVLRAVSAPPGTDTVTLSGSPNRLRFSSSILRGPLLMAGEPGG